MNEWGRAAFAPQRIALVGASAEAGKVGRLVMDNLGVRPPGTEAGTGYAGEVVPIHPQAREILGRRAYPDLTAAPGPIDLAVIVTPAAATPRVLADCAAARVAVAIILSGGYAETGADGAALEAEVVRAARAGGVRLIGPNCFGLIDVRSGLNASLAMGLPARGGVSLFTQSGSYGMAAFSRSKEEGTLDEERRLFYVAITRAMQTLNISHCIARKKYGQAVPCHPSAFLHELPPELVEHADEKAKQPVSTQSGKERFAALLASLDEA